MTPPRVLAAAGVSAGGNPGKDVGASLRGAAGTPPPTVCPGTGGRGSLPLIRPCGATFPQGGRQGLLLAAAQGFAGRRGRRPLRVARGRAAGGACPSSGPAGPPSPKGEGKGCSGGIHPSRGVGGGGRSRRGGGTPPYGWGYGSAVGFTWAPVSGPPRGRGRACPARGFTRTPVNGLVRREGS